MFELWSTHGQGELDTDFMIPKQDKKQQETIDQTLHRLTV